MADGWLHGEGRLLVDAMNVLASRPDGWWRDREAAYRRLVDQLQPLAQTRPGPVIVVVEGRAGDALAPGRHGDVEVVHASARGRDAADDHLVVLVTDGADASSDEPSTDTVVTADRELRDRVRAAGAMVIGPGSLRRHLEGSTR